MLFLDTETYNEKVDIKVGTYRYAETAQLNLLTYAHDNDPAALWDYTRDRVMPEELHYYLYETDEPICAHKADFDRLILHFTLGFPLDPRRWRCSMAKAYAHGLPGAIDKLTRILGIENRAMDKGEGRKMMLFFCKPQNGKRRTRATDPAKWIRYCTYALDDIEDMRDIWNKLPDWNYRGKELELWHLDQTINDRGIYVDRALCTTAVQAARHTKNRANWEMRSYSNGNVDTVDQRDKLLNLLLNEHGVVLPDMAASTLERRLNDESLPEVVHELIKLRLVTAKSSTTKYRAFINATSKDGRVRGMMQFDGAQRTGRFSGKVVQLHNMARPDMPWEDIQFGIDAIKGGLLDVHFKGEEMRVLSNAVRGVLTAAPGKKLVVADLSNIEGRALAWLAGEQWKIKAFADYDAGTGPDLYNVAYSSSFGVPVDKVTKDERQIGKVEELSLGYRGAEGAFVSMGVNYGVDVGEAFPTVWRAASPELRKRAVSYHKWAAYNGIPVAYTLNLKPFLAACVIKIAWRDTNKRIVAYWDEVETAVLNALYNPGQIFDVLHVKVLYRDGWLRIRLPSGRIMCYPQMHAEDSGDKPKLSYMGINQYTKQWGKIRTYSGKLVENITQAMARDVLVHGMMLAEKAGYAIVLTVHDEIVAEVPDSEKYSAEELCRIMSTVPSWAPGLPLAAGGFETDRYHKE